MNKLKMELSKSSILESLVSIKLVMLPSLLFGEPSRAFWLASRAEPSFSIFKNEPNTSLQKFSTLNKYRLV